MYVKACWLFSLIVVLWMVGCAVEHENLPLTEDIVLVQVGDYKINNKKLRHFEKRLPETLSSKQEGVNAVREHLQSMVDRHLILMEAQKLGFETDLQVQKKLDEVSRQRLIETVFKTFINPKIGFSEKELEAAYEEYDLGWQVLPAHILSASEADAREVMRLLEAGEDFFEVAKQKSLADDAHRGGDLGNFFSQGDAVPVLREGTFHLPKGAHSQPLKTVDGYEIVKIIDRRRVAYANLRDNIAKQMAERKVQEEKTRILEKSKEQHQMRFHEEQMKHLLRGVRAGKLDSSAGTERLFSFKTGGFTVSQCLEFVLNNTSRKLQLAIDSLGVVRPLENKLVADELWVRYARGKGLDKEADFQVWREERLKEIMAKRLFATRIANTVKVTSAEVKAYYNDNIDVYRVLPGSIELTEVLVPSEAEANDILTAARAGESLKELAQKHSLRHELSILKGYTLGDSGYVRIDSLIVTPYREALGDTNINDVGKLMGPLPMQDRFSVYRLERPIEWATVPFKQYRRPIGFRLRKQREEKEFTVYIDSLRSAYADQISWFDDNINALEKIN